MRIANARLHLSPLYLLRTNAPGSLVLPWLRKHKATISAQRGVCWLGLLLLNLLHCSCYSLSSRASTSKRRDKIRAWFAAEAVVSVMLKKIMSERLQCTTLRHRVVFMPSSELRKRRRQIVAE